MSGKPKSTVRDDLIAVLQKRTTVAESGCWEWQGSRSKQGYGQINRIMLSKHPTTIHRLSWQIHYGEIPEGMCVLHGCDNPPCWKPEHLFLGTHQDNTDDKIQKGRMRHGHLYGDNHPARKSPVYLKRGLDHPGHKLTPETVRDIRKLAASEGHGAIAKRLGVSRGCVAAVLKGKNWKEIK